MTPALEKGKPAKGHGRELPTSGQFKAQVLKDAKLSHAVAQRAMHGAESGRAGQGRASGCASQVRNNRTASSGTG